MKKQIKNIFRIIDNLIGKRLFSLISIDDLSIRDYIVEKRDYFYEHKETNNLTIISQNISKKQILLNSHQYQRENSVHKAFVYKLSGGKFKISRGGFVIFRNSKILLESCNHEEIYFSRFFSKIALRIGLLSTSRKNVNHIYALEHKLDFNYWHLHAELIPQIAVILNTFFTETTEKMSVLIRKDFPTVYREMLYLLFEDRVLLIESGFGYIRSNFVYVTGEMYSRQFQKGGYFIQSRNLAFWDAVNVFKPRKSKIPKVAPSSDVVLISRRRATSRRLLNEDDLVRALTSKGISVNVVSLEDYFWVEQLSVLQATKIVVAPHGAHSGSLLYLRDIVYCELANLERKKGLGVLTDVLDICLFTGVTQYIVNVAIYDDLNEDYYINDLQELVTLILRIL